MTFIRPRESVPVTSGSPGSTADVAKSLFRRPLLSACCRQPVRLAGETSAAAPLRNSEQSKSETAGEGIVLPPLEYLKVGRKGDIDEETCKKC